MTVDAAGERRARPESEAWSAAGTAARRPTPAGGVSVDGDGVHTVSCTAWNQAEGPNGSGATGTRSLAVRIDEAPPSTGFEPQNPAIRPASSSTPATANRASRAGRSRCVPPPAERGRRCRRSSTASTFSLISTTPDSTAPTSSRPTACDNVGNCSATGQQLALPLRLASSSNVSFKNIVNPAQPRVVRERVRVGWHWAKIRRHGRLVRVKRGGHFKTIKVVKIVKHCTEQAQCGSPATAGGYGATCKIPKLHLKRTDRVRFGHKVTIHGLLTTAQGIPLAGVPVQIMAAPDNGLGAFAPAAAATTGADGSWNASLPPGPSRLIRAVYGGAATILPASGLAKVIVPAKVKLTSITPRRLPWGKSVRISGRVLGGYIPASSKLLRLDIGVVGLSKIQGIPDIAPDGRFSVTYTFGPGRGVVRFWFMVSTLAEADFPFAPGHSQACDGHRRLPTPTRRGASPSPCSPPAGQSSAPSPQATKAMIARHRGEHDSHWGRWRPSAGRQAPAASAAADRG